MKKKILLFMSCLSVLFVMCTFSAPAYAADIIASGSCGYDSAHMKNTDDATFVLYSDGNFVVSGTGGIGPNAFNNKAFSNDIKYVTINEGITDIKYTFSGCTSLKSVTISDSVKDMSGAFRDCTNLTKITVPNGVTDITESFVGCTSLTDVNIPNSVTNIDCTFLGCSSLTEITIPASVTTMYSGYYDRNRYSSAMEHCQNFSGCKLLKKINVSSDSKTFKSVDGVLFSKDGKTLFQYPAGKSGDSYSVSPGTTAIGQGAFDDCVNLKQITLNNGLKDIGPGVFAGCGIETLSFPSSMTYIPSGLYNTNLKKIFIPASVKQLGNGNSEQIFYVNKDESLDLDVYFEGSKEDWDNMEWQILLEKYEGLMKARIHYNATGLPPEAVPCFTVSGSTVTNTADTEQTAVVVCADYTDGALTDVNTQTLTFSAGESKRFSYGRGAAHKIFVWDSVENMRPLTI